MPGQSAGWPDGMIVGFDLETTSPDPMTALPVSYALSFFDGQQLVSTQRSLIDPGVPTDPGAIAVHGITNKMVHSEGVSLDVGLPQVVDVLMEYSSLGHPVVGMNLRYDLTIIDRLHRETFDGAGLTELGWDGPVIDVSVIDRRMDKWRKGKRKLSDLCQHYGVDLDHAQAAGADAEASVRVALAIAAAYPEIGEASPRDLHTLQIGRHREWADDFSDWRVGKGMEPLDPSEGDWPFSRA
jgi:DNA polymerase-3 subunit epsilon